MEKTVVLSLGGSLIAPGPVDTGFLKSFRECVNGFLGRGYRFAIVCGGGKVAREYQEAVSTLMTSSGEAQDWIGISATVLNAHLIMILFGKDAHPVIVQNPTKKVSFTEKVLVSSGWKPGWSTDYVAVLHAKQLKVGTVINLSDIPSVYDKDPKKHKDAVPLHTLTWDAYRKISGNTWQAGLSLPFDPVAAKRAQAEKMKAIIIGRDLKNFQNVLNDLPFKGTVIS